MQGLGFGRGKANLAHIRQSRPDSGIGFQAKVLHTFEGFPSSLGSGPGGGSGTRVVRRRLEQQLYRNVQRFRSGLVFKARRLLYLSTLGSRVIKQRRRGSDRMHQTGNFVPIKEQN